MHPPTPAPLPPTPQQALVVGLRRSLVPRLRKYLLHPGREVRVMAVLACFSLGCLSQDMMSRVLDCGPTSIQVRAAPRRRLPTALPCPPALRELAATQPGRAGTPAAAPPPLPSALACCRCCCRAPRLPTRSHAPPPAAPLRSRAWWLG